MIPRELTETLVASAVDSGEYTQFTEAQAPTVPNPKLNAMIVPREHGAWGMLLIPLATGAVVAPGSAMNYAALVWFVIASLSLFWMRTPLEAWLGSTAIKANSRSQRTAVACVSLALALLAMVAVFALFRAGRFRGLLPIGCIAAAAFALRAGVKSMGRVGRMPAQIIGAIGLTSTAAGAYYVSTGHLNHVALSLWIANWVFAADQVHFVQVRIRGSRLVSPAEKARKVYGFLMGQIALVVVLVTCSKNGLLPRYAVVAFVPALLRGFLWYCSGPTRLDVHRLGFSELVQALIFGVLLCIVFLI